MSRAAAEAEVFIPEGIGERIRFIRERRRISQSDLARKLRERGVSVHQSVLARFERWGADPPDPNARKPQFRHLLVIAEILNVKLSQLGVTEEEYPELRFLRDPAYVKKHIHP